MIRENTPPIAKQPNVVRTILSAWLLAGTMDITTASIYYPLRYEITRTTLYQNIASGVFGERAFAGGMQMAALGLMFHYFIAFFWTVVFFMAYPRIKIFWRSRFVSGVVYGLLVWLAMNLVVLPLSNVNHSPFDFAQALIGAVILMFCIGLPNAIIVSKHYSQHS
jgi:uncharacterized membrane protein YagU involved in acid resistance